MLQFCRSKLQIEKKKKKKKNGALSFILVQNYI